jgi:hypothetical protein
LALEQQSGGKRRKFKTPVFTVCVLMKMEKEHFIEKCGLRFSERLTRVLASETYKPFGS